MTRAARPTCTWDMLTEVDDSIAPWANAPDDLAPVDSHDAGCKWSPAWYNDRCAYEAWDLAGDDPWSNDWYDRHSPRQEPWGDDIGAWDCTGWVTGSYVFGPAQNCWQD